MQRICTSLQHEGYDVWLIGVQHANTKPLQSQVFHQKRLNLWFKKGVFFYAEYNIKLFIYLLFTKGNVYCAIDLDTIIPVYISSLIKNKKRVYDAHELFTELNEVVSRPFVLKFWKAVEKFFVPKFKHGYTVNVFIKNYLNKTYKVEYGVIRNIPIAKNLKSVTAADEKFIIYQGAVNKGRGFKQLIEAMQMVTMPLHIYGTGNALEKVQQWIAEFKVQHKVILKGEINPNELQQITPTAFCGITIFEPLGLNQTYSLANRFFDYMMAGVPQICVAYPEYQTINSTYQFAFLIDDIEPATIATALNNLANNSVLYQQLKQNAIIAQQHLNWQSEEKKLLQFWRNICT
jgi:glycosyltransferase involved in cell wall biosynthesis